MVQINIENLKNSSLSKPAKHGFILKMVPEPLLCFFAKLNVATGTHYAVAGPELMHTNDCAAKNVSMSMRTQQISESIPS